MKTERVSYLNRTPSSALLALMLTLFIPGCGHHDTAADEAGVIGALKTLAVSQRLYSKAHYGAYGTFDQLITDTDLNKRFAGDAPVVGGYIFKMKVTPKASYQPPFFTVNADPEGGNGKHFYIDTDSQTVRVNDKQPAGPEDPPVLQE